MAIANEQDIWNYLSRCNLNNAAVAGIMGNMQAESSFDLAAVGDRGTSFGLCQWHDDRGRNMKAYCSEYGGDWRSNLNGQLGYLMLELNDPVFMSDATLGVDLLAKLRQVPNTQAGIREASTLWLKHFERPTDQGAAVQQERYEYGAEIYKVYAGSSSPTSTISTMTVGKAILAKAQGEVGVRETGNNNVKYNTWYYGKEVNGDDYAWCAVFLKWCANEANVSIPGWDPGISKSNAPDSWNGNAISNGTWISREKLQSGDIIFFTWGHVGIVESRDGNTLHTIEGNSSNSVRRLTWDIYENNPYGSGYAISGGQRLDGTTSKPVNQSGSAVNSTAASAINYHIEYQEVSAEVKTSTIYTADVDANAQRTRANNLLTTPTLVESPFIWLTVGNYTFGSYSINGSYDSVNSNITVNYPNYMTGIKITKVNGQVNQYIITMVYQIRNGDDPNLLDKIFSSVGYGKVHISYGDWNAPKFIYRDEEAVITKLSTDVDFANSRITYILNCTSNALVLMSNCHSEPANTLKPSQRIHDMIYKEESKYGLQKVFTAFANNETFFWECVAADDVAVEVVAKTLIDPLNYINYLVTCMSPTTTPKNSAIRDANYYLTIREDKDKGTYFTIKKVSSSEGVISLNNSDVYEVDVGYPGDTLVTSFKIKNDNSWSLLYNYAENINTDEYSYNIDSQGNIYTTYSPSLMTSNKYLKTTETQKNWWTQMTQFPISATLTIKGLLRPAMLMSYVRVNALFYGLRHVSSGLYIITKQEDSVDYNGYRTTLTLTRVAGDLDAIITETKTVTTQVPIYVMDTVSSSSTSNSNTGVHVVGNGSGGGGHTKTNLVN